MAEDAHCFDLPRRPVNPCTPSGLIEEKHG